MFQGYTPAETRTNKWGELEYTHRLSTAQASAIEVLRLARAEDGIDGFRQQWQNLPASTRAALLRHGAVSQWGVTKAGRSMYDTWYSNR